MKRCVYQDCDSVQYPCSRMTFFLLPNDRRRNTWIQNSGNKSILKIGEKATRSFCENHFRECDIRSQFNRKTLRRDAVPIAYNSLDSNKMSMYADYDGSNVIYEDKNNQQNIEIDESLVENTDDQKLYDEITVFDTITTDAATTSLAEGNVNVPYSLMDIYDDAHDVPSTSSSILLENPKVETSIKTVNQQQDEVSLEVYLDENSNNNQVDSSTLELEIEDEEPVDDDVRECEIVPAKKKRPIKVESVVETTTNEDIVIPTPNNNNSYEEDKHFALSLVGYFQRLPQAKKALAKLKILQYLTELEIDLPPSL